MTNTNTIMYVGKRSADLHPENNNNEKQNYSW